ncbi:MAG: tripartite tricarboxylate transporter TctB family protein [Dichotomicrobium sp.]
MSEMSASKRLQHLLPNTLITGLAAFVTWLSFTQEPAAAYLFPRLISVFMLVMAVWSLGRAVLGMSRVGTGLSAQTALNLAPGVALILIYVFWAAKTLGFYTASTAAFLLLFTIYDPAPIISLRGWIKRIVITAGFMAVIYALFTVLLKVQVPRGMFL